MNKRELILQTLVLVYKESLVDNKSNALYDWVKESISVEKNGLGADHSKNIENDLREVLTWALGQSEKGLVDKKQLTQKIKMAVGTETYMLDIVTDQMATEHDASIINKDCLDIRRALSDYKRKVDMTSLITKVGMDLKFNHAIDHRKAAIELINNLTPLVATGAAAVEGDLTSVKFGDLNALSEQIRKGKESSSVEGILTTGWKGMNAMMGEEGGIRRGDLVCVGALQHNFKSGTLLALAKHFCLYNTPYMLDEKKKPCIIFISLENNSEDNVLLLYRSLKENETGEVVNIQDIDIDEAAAYIKEQLGKNGYEFCLHRCEAGGFTIQSLIDLLTNYINDGYEIHACIIDYLNLFSKEGCVGGNESGQIRDLFRKARAFCNPRLISLITAHQLSSEAKYLLRQGVDDFVREVANKGYWDSCKSIDQELDLEIIQNIEKPGDGRSYLAFARGKHRKAGAVTPEVDLYYVQRFERAGSIRDDVNLSKALYSRKVGGGTVGADGSTESGEWWADVA